MIDKFKDYMRELRLSQNSIDSYYSDVVLYEKYYKDSYGDDLNKLVFADILMYKQYLLNNSISPKTINRKLTSLRTYNRFLIKEKIQNIYDKIILHQLDSNPDAIKAYYQIKNKESKPFVLWQLYFPKVFKEKQGFDIVIGNPPYGLINKKQNQNTSISANKYEIEVYKKKNIYKPAKGGIINIFRLFVCKSFDLLRDNGHLSLIFPMAFMCDLSAKSLREYILNNNKIDYTI